MVEQASASDGGQQRTLITPYCRWDRVSTCKNIHICILQLNDFKKVHGHRRHHCRGLTLACELWVGIPTFPLTFREVSIVSRPVFLFKCKLHLCTSSLAAYKWQALAAGQTAVGARIAAHAMWQRFSSDTYSSTLHFCTLCTHM